MLGVVLSIGAGWDWISLTPGVLSIGLGRGRANDRFLEYFPILLSIATMVTKKYYIPVKFTVHSLITLRRITRTSGLNLDTKKVVNDLSSSMNEHVCLWLVESGVLSSFSSMLITSPVSC